MITRSPISGFTVRKSDPSSRGCECPIRPCRRFPSRDGRNLHSIRRPDRSLTRAGGVNGGWSFHYDLRPRLSTQDQGRPAIDDQAALEHEATTAVRSEHYRLLSTQQSG